MSRRSANNQRYQKHTQLGKTRRSAASAKPKRDKGSASSSPVKSKGKSAKRARVAMYPDTPEFKRWRRIWLWLLVAAMVFSISAFVLRDGGPYEAGPTGTLTLVAAYTCLFGAFYIDLTKIRRMRKEWLAEQAAGKTAEKDKG
ncbi:MAG: hypothetical protein U1E29_02360 [Coriobacteriia bacterium]|nr:hypothetical protein [Coriobacteriia bacterium]